MQLGATVALRITGPDHAPELPASRLRLPQTLLDESTPGGVEVFSAEDVGASGGTQPVFSLEGEHASLYAIDARTGRITTRAGVERDYESAPDCYLPAGYYGRCHRMRVRATSGVGPASATREVWVRLGDAFEFQARSTGPGVLVLKWRQRPEISYYCPDSGHDLWYRPVTRQDDPDGNLISRYRPHERRFGPGTTEVELTGLFPDHEYYVWMRERYASGCGFGNGAQDWVKSRVRTEGHGAAPSVPRVSLTFPDPENPDDFNAPVRGETTVVEGKSGEVSDPRRPAGRGVLPLGLRRGHVPSELQLGQGNRARDAIVG